MIWFREKRVVSAIERMEDELRRDPENRAVRINLSAMKKHLRALRGEDTKQDDPHQCPHAS